MATRCKSERNKKRAMYRDRHVVIPVFQTAYIRKKIIDIALQHIKRLSYIDTDGLILLSGKYTFKGKISDKIGDFKQEYKDVRIDFIRHRGYFVKDENGCILHHMETDEMGNEVRKNDGQVYSGIIADFTDDEVEKLMNGETIIKKDERISHGKRIIRPFSITKNINTREMWETRD